MADHVIIAQKRADAQRDFEREAGRLATRLGLPPVSPVPQEIRRDQRLVDAVQLENIAKFLRDMNQALDKKDEGAKAPKPQPPVPVPVEAPPTPASGAESVAVRAKRTPQR